MKYLLTIWFCTSLFCAIAQDQDNRLRHFNLTDNLALDGYDPVSYIAGKPIEGNKDISYLYKGIKYYFANARNRNTFISTPDQYEPAYGGWCAYAMGKKGEKVRVNPETFKIIDGKVYLFYNFWGNNTLEDWDADERQLKSSADRQWKKYGNP